MTEILAMWRVSPGVVGMIQDANRANLQTAMYQHALICECVVAVRPPRHRLGGGCPLAAGGLPSARTSPSGAQGRQRSPAGRAPPAM